MSSLHTMQIKVEESERKLAFYLNTFGKVTAYTDFKLLRPPSIQYKELCIAKLYLQRDSTEKGMSTFVLGDVFYMQMRSQPFTFTNLVNPANHCQSSLICSPGNAKYISFIQQILCLSFYIQVE